MQRQKLRVMLASEYPELRYFLRGVVEEGSGALVVAQAENAVKALTLTRNLRPDVAIIDCDLPYTVGLDAVRLSRIGGLDTAQAISEEIPNTRVILLCNPELKLLPELSLSRDTIPFFSRKTNGSTTPFTLQELYQETVLPNNLIFANVETKRVTPLLKDGDKAGKLSGSEKLLLFGGLGIASGWFLTLTVVLAPVGAFLALAGALTMLLGLVGRLSTKHRLRVSLNEKTKNKNAKLKG